MCGIFGAIGNRINESAVRRATEALVHRGPDDVGHYIDPHNGACLGHRRLSIIDLSAAGHQPFSDRSGRYHLVYNGEIYNYLELRKELVDVYSFRTETDTEVLLASYLTWGPSCVERFNGMFAFAIWDSKEQSLFCARDRLGEKPFFYMDYEGGLIFASEIKALLTFGKRAHNEAIIKDYLLYGLYDHTGETFFEGIRMLPQGSTLLYRDGKKEISTYWDVRGAIGNYEYTDATVVKETFSELLADSLRLRFRSDVPVGINLSSGLDSNMLYAYAKKVMGHDVNLYSMCTEEEQYNECLLIADTLSEREKTHWYTSRFEAQELIDGVLKMNGIQDQPYGGIPTIAYGKLMETAQQTGTTVLIEGQGLDELLGGYAYYRSAYERDLLQEQGLEVAPSGETPGVYSQDATLLIDHDILEQEVTHGPSQLNIDAPFESHLQNAQYRDLRYTKLPRVLRFNDHASMAYGRELRLPFLDYRLVEFCFWLPTEYKINAQAQKVLGRAVAEDIVPERVHKTMKRSFGAMQNSWLRRYGKEFIRDILSSASFRQRHYWNHERLTAKSERFFEGEGENSFYLWQAINLELWLRRFID